MPGKQKQGYLSFSGALFFLIHGVLHIWFCEFIELWSFGADDPASVVEAVVICRRIDKNHLCRVFRIIDELVGCPFAAVSAWIWILLFRWCIYGKSVAAFLKIQVHGNSSFKPPAFLIVIYSIRNGSPLVGCLCRGVCYVIAIHVLDFKPAADGCHLFRVFRPVDYQLPWIVVQFNFIFPLGMQGRQNEDYECKADKNSFHGSACIIPY